MRRDKVGRWIGRLVALGVLVASVFVATVASTDDFEWSADFEWSHSVAP